MRASIAVLGTITLLTTVGMGWSDDGVVFATGGTARLMSSHASVRMVREEVRIKLYPDRAEVDCSFVFKNEGKATTVQIGFPETLQGGTDTSAQTAPKLRNFRAYLDGQPVSYRILKASERRGEYGIAYWYVRTVHFAAGQQRTTRVTYSAELGGDSVGRRFFPYVLRTGASWKGSIGYGRIVIDGRSLQPDYAVEIRDNGEFRRQGNLLVWEFLDLEPTDQHDLFISIEPRNIIRLYIRSSSPPNEPTASYLPLKWQGEPTAIVRNGVLYAQWDALAEALGLMPRTHWHWDSSQRRLRVVVAGRTLIARPNETRVSVNQQMHGLKSPLLYQRAIYKEPLLWVPVREFLKLLGYEVQIERSVSKETSVINYKVIVSQAINQVN